MNQHDKDEAIRQAVENRLIKRAVTDLDFRRLLLDNPKSALARELGIDVPDDIHVTVLQESESHVFIVIPASESVEVKTGVRTLADRIGPGYGTGVSRLTGGSAAYPGPAFDTGLSRLAGGNAGYATGLERLAIGGSGYTK